MAPTWEDNSSASTIGACVIKTYIIVDAWLGVIFARAERREWLGPCEQGCLLSEPNPQSRLWPEPAGLYTSYMPECGAIPVFSQVYLLVNELLRTFDTLLIPLLS
jgi:hypothetical protein